ncbi:MAG TPA: hypothetical protein VJ925_07945 [Longimicrobiales bacterium]|nr:hypothetical protein [Longimicrobiales bacterium]
MIGLVGAGVLTLGACDDDVEGVITNLEFTGDFQALNSSGVNGIVDVITDDVENEFIVSVEAGELAPEITHAQHIHAAGQCPTMEDDANGDGYLDVIEGLPSYGGILIPLDSNLPDQAAGDFPIADASGIVDYRNSTTFTSLIAGIEGEDSDIYAELAENEALLPESRTVVLHGVLPSTELPESVASLAGLPSNVTLPVACAELERKPARNP